MFSVYGIPNKGIINKFKTEKEAIKFAESKNDSRLCVCETKD